MRQAPESTEYKARDKARIGATTIGKTLLSEVTAEERSQANQYYFDSPLSEIDPVILTSSIPDVFEQFVCSLSADLQLSRGGFVLAHHGTAHDRTPATDSHLSLIAISDNDTVCAGLGIAIPREHSALHEISDSNCLKTVIPAKDWQGNFVERHALIVSADGCLGMYPLEIDQLTIGVVTLNFGKCTACNEASDKIALAKTRLARRIAKVAPRSASIPATALEL
jgi:hypothetical protein